MERMKELIVLLNKAAYAYYQEDKEIMSDHEYDILYDELLQLEKETNTVDFDLTKPSCIQRTPGEGAAKSQC